MQRIRTGQFGFIGEATSRTGRKPLARKVFEQKCMSVRCRVEGQCLQDLAGQSRSQYLRSDRGEDSLMPIGIQPKIRDGRSQLPLQKVASAVVETMSDNAQCMWQI